MLTRWVRAYLATRCDAMIARECHEERDAQDTGNSTSAQLEAKNAKRDGLDSDARSAAVPNADLERSARGELELPAAIMMVVICVLPTK